MTNNRGILYDTAECLSSAVRDFYKVIPFLENPDNKSITFRDFTQSISNMRHSFLDYEDLVMRACYMINVSGITLRIIVQGFTKCLYF